MEGFSGVINQLIEAVKKRFEEQDKNLLTFVGNVREALDVRDKHIQLLTDQIQRLTMQVKDLQSVGADKILLEEKHGSEDLGSDNEYRANTNDR